MIVETTITYNEEDKKLLKQVIPDDPCDKCPQSYACCGCTKGRAYKDFIQPYKDANILEIAILLRERRNKKLKIKELQKRVDEINALVPDFCKEKSAKAANLQPAKISFLG